MSPAELLRWAIAPLQRRGLLLLAGGLAAFLAAGGLATLLAVPAAAKWVLYAAMLGGWLAACAGMVGTVRYLYGHAVDEMRKVQAGRMNDRP